MKAKILAEENKKWWTLGAVSIGLFMIMLDNTVVNVALNSIQGSLKLKTSELEWVVAGYALTFGAFMLTGGKLADLFGRRLMFVTGLVIFTGSSLACGLASGPSMLIAARVVQGLGAALMNPATLSIITVTFPPRQRGMAIGIWAGVAALALAIGPLLGGIITERINWNWIFFVNIPVGIIGVIAAFAFIAESKDTSHEQRPDLPGLLTSTLGLFALTYALIEANTFGWGSTRIIAAFAIAIVSLVAFVLLELHQRLAMLDLSLFTSRTFAGANGVLLLMGLAMFGVFFYVSLYLQKIIGYSPIQTGAAFLPWTLLIMVVAPQAGRLSDKFGPRWFVTGGMLLVAGSLFLFSRMGTHESFWGLLPAMVLGGIGMAAAMSPTTATAMGSVPPDKAGVGSAVLNSARQVGGSFGIALIGAIVLASTGTSARPNPNDYVTGFHHALEVATLIALAGAAIGAATLRKVHHPAGQPAPVPAVEA